MTTHLRPGWIATAIAPCLLVAAGHTQWIEDSINCGGPWVGSMVYNSRADVVYGASEQPGIIFTISCDSNKVISSIYLHWPHCVTYASSVNKAYCTVYNNHESDSVLVIDGFTHERIKAIPLDWARVPIWDSVSDQVFVSCGEENKVAVIDCATDSVIDRIRVGQYPIGLDINDRHRKLYVRNDDSETVSIVDLETNEVIETIRLSGAPEAGCYCAAVDKYYCSAGIAVAVIDGAGDSLIKEIPLPYGNRAKSLIAVEAHELVMVGGSTGGWDSVFVLDAEGDSVVAMHPVGRGPRGLVWSPATDLVYVANGYSDDISVIAGNGSAVLCSLPVAHGPFVFVSAPRHERLYLGHLGSRMVYVIKDRAGGVHDGSDVTVEPLCLLRARPSHFVGRAVIEYCGAADVPVKLVVYAQDGRLVRRLSAGAARGERQRYVWDGRDEKGNRVPRGVYTVMACGANPCRTKVVKLGRSGI